MQNFLVGYKGEPAKPASSTDKKAASGHKQRLVPWIEKYRPKTVDQIAHQGEVVAVLKKCLQGADLPNFLFYGPPGTGKTSAALAMARELFGADFYRDRVLELNASDERGIQVIRDKVKVFAQFAASSSRPDGKPCPPLKLIILDEADSMTGPAQAALRRTMEKESRTTRFVLICNYISRIIEPLTSRCAKFRFKPLPENVLAERLRSICTDEGVNISESAMQLLMSSCEGDLRRAITFLQSSSKFRDASEEVNEKDMAEIVGVMPAQWVDGFLEVCQRNSYDDLEAFLRKMLREGYAAYQMLTQLHDTLITKSDLNDQQKAVIFEKLAVCDKRLLDGADEYLQMLDFACTVMLQYSNSESL